MALNHPRSGPNNAPQYQMSGVPFITSSVADEVKGVHNSAASPEPININFDYVTKWIEIENTDSTNSLRIAFTERGAFASGERLPSGGTKATGDYGHYIVVGTGKKVKYDFRCTSLFFVSNATASGTPEASGNSAGFAIRAGLTTIPASNFPVLTGSIDGTVAFEGVG